MLERVWRKGNLLHCWWESNLVQSTYGNFLRKLKVELPYDPATPLLVYIQTKLLQNYKTTKLLWKDTCIPMFIAALFTIARTTNRWTNKDVVHIYNRLLLSHKNEWNIDMTKDYHGASLKAQVVKNPPTMWEAWVWSLGWEDPLKKDKTTHSSILTWRIPWTVESMGSQRVGHHWATFTPQRLSY